MAESSIAKKSNGDAIQNSSNNRGYRIFESEQSPYDQLLEKDGIFQVLHYVIAFEIVSFMVGNIIYDTFVTGSLQLHFHHTTDQFGSIGDFLRFLVFFELPLLTCTLAIHPMLKVWESSRRYLPRIVVDGVFALMYLGIVLASFPFTISSCDTLEFKPFLRVTASIENVRVCMKSYSFIRENVYKVLYPWHKDDKSGPAVWYAGQMSPTVGSFNQYCYYLFGPMLLYRDHYPRLTGSIRWKKAIVYFIYFWLLIVLELTVENKYIMPVTLKYNEVLKCFLCCVIYGFPMVVMAHICALQCYLNFGAELSQLADRKFYSDWWTSSEYAQYYRKWNLLVHEYIHQYLYRDIKAMLPTRLVGTFLSIALSALVHEYIISMGTGFFSPILIFNFCICGVIFFVWPFKSTRTTRNCITMISLGIGLGLMTFMYTIELKSRRLCSRDTTPEIAGLRMFHCIAKYN